jgi:hypothetical protein
VVGPLGTKVEWAMYTSTGSEEHEFRGIAINPTRVFYKHAEIKINHNFPAKEPHDNPYLKGSKTSHCIHTYCLGHPTQVCIGDSFCVFFEIRRAYLSRERWQVCPLTTSLHPAEISCCKLCVQCSVPSSLPTPLL